MRVIISLLLAAMLATPVMAASSSALEHPGVQLAENSQVVHGNAKSRIYHNASCKYFNCKACTVVFKSTAEAKAKGFRACKVCGG